MTFFLSFYIIVQWISYSKSIWRQCCSSSRLHHDSITHKTDEVIGNIFYISILRFCLTCTILMHQKEECCASRKLNRAPSNCCKMITLKDAKISDIWFITGDAAGLIQLENVKGCYFVKQKFTFPKTETAIEITVPQIRNLCMAFHNTFHPT